MSLPPFNEFISSQTSLSQKIKVIDILFEHSDSLIFFILKHKVFKIANDQDIGNVLRDSKDGKSNIIMIDTYPKYIELVRQRLLTIVDLAEQEGISSFKIDHLTDIIGSHPRLGGSSSNKTCANTLNGGTEDISIHSLNEQKSLNSKDDPETNKKLIALNDEYESRYEGLKFVCFVNGRTRAKIIQIMESRINSGNSWFDEVRIGINEMCDIAIDRAKKYTDNKQYL
ncbi:uncharacterized protein SCODWIG_00964 [Saccharomycodes ludwigii]|uniref:Oxo-4-hydroxy-4-carboxy-5-ureidoimidazoline decarboxylase domain-containing protein n=2 Tax=Saccharomycodes ludwigii TaxID=36035 RepID=A0A376B3F0_9ASCO|nr:uncharacterized protein SCODWIG_00964 [Saccharomycodes ludwigii]